MKTIRYTVPPTTQMGSHVGTCCASYSETIAQSALWDYNSARAHDGLPPLNRMPAGTTYHHPAAPYYIQRKDGGEVETVDEFATRKEAQEMRKEYAMSDPTARFYISRRACRAWLATDEIPG